MRVSRFLPLGALLLGCSVDLAPSAEPAPVEVPVTELEACDLLPDLDGLRGRTTPITLPGEVDVLLSVSPDFEGSTASALFEVDGGSCDAASMPRASRPVLDVSAHGDVEGSPRSGFFSDASYLYFSLDPQNGLESAGAGIARYDEASQAFVSLGLLWTGDRPRYGSAVVLDGEYAYVYGGLPARFLAADVYLARVPLDQLAEPAAYEYFQGGGAWSNDPDLAGPLLEGGEMPSVWRAGPERYLMAYTTPLAQHITLRSGLGPAGPWSRPVRFGACSLPFEQAFCGEVSLLPGFAAEGEVALSQTIDSFEAPAGATARDFWTKLVRGPVPSDLP
jgi:hypothetical protein